VPPQSLAELTAAPDACLTSAARASLWAYRLALPPPNHGPALHTVARSQSSVTRKANREAAADQLHCASGVARRDVTRNASPSSEAGGSLALRTGRDNKHCDAAKFSSDSSADSFPRGPFRRPFCCALAPHNVALSSPLKTALARRLPKPPRAPQPPRQARFAPAGPRPRAPLPAHKCRRRSKQSWFVLAALESSRSSIAAGLADSRCVFKSGSPVLVLSPVTGPLPHHGAKQRGAL